MPGYDGMRVLHEVVEVRGCQEPVILITGAKPRHGVGGGPWAFDYIKSRSPVRACRTWSTACVTSGCCASATRRGSASWLLKNLAEIGGVILSHEIKTPITGLRHALSAVGDKLSVEDGVLIDEFADNLARIERLLGATLSFAKPLSPGGDAALRRHQRRGERVEDLRVVRLCASVDVDAGVVVDRQILAEVFENLLRNAADACSGKARSASRRRVGRTESPSTSLTTAPGSTGPYGEVFKPFRSFKDKGTGIGLAFARKVVEAHGATIDLKASEHGACFRITLPSRMLVCPDDSAGEPTQYQLDEPKHITIILIDDQAIVRAAFRSLLNSVDGSR